MNKLQNELLMLISICSGANQTLYIPFDIFFGAIEADYSKSEISDELTVVVNKGYLETTDQSYRLTSKGMIYVEMLPMINEVRETLEQNQREISRNQWIGILIAFLIMLAIIFIFR